MANGKKTTTIKPPQLVSFNQHLGQSSPVEIMMYHGSSKSLSEFFRQFL